MSEEEQINNNKKIISESLNEFHEIAIAQCEPGIERMFMSNLLALLFWSRFQTKLNVDDELRFSFDFDFKFKRLLGNYDEYELKQLRKYKWKQIGDQHYRLSELIIKNIQPIKTEIIESNLKPIYIETYEIFRLFPQHRVDVDDNRYFSLDFAVFYETEVEHITKDSKKIAIELDGHAYHSSPEARTKDANRDRTLQSLGWKVIRFTGREVQKMSDIESTKSIIDLLRQICKHD